MSRGLFLSSSAELLRESLRPAPMLNVASRMAMILLLGATGFLVGRAVLGMVLRRVQTLGTIGHA